MSKQQELNHWQKSASKWEAKFRKADGRVLDLTQQVALLTDALAKANRSGAEAQAKLLDQQDKMTELVNCRLELSDERCRADHLHEKAGESESHVGRVEASLEACEKRLCAITEAWCDNCDDAHMDALINPLQ